MAAPSGILSVSGDRVTSWYSSVIFEERRPTSDGSHGSALLRVSRSFCCGYNKMSISLQAYNTESPAEMPILPHAPPVDRFDRILDRLACLQYRAGLT